MIIQTGQVLKIGEWAEKKDNYLGYMRGQIERSAQARDLVLGHEIVETVEIRHNGKEWVSAKGADITHVKVLVQRQAEHA